MSPASIAPREANAIGDRNSLNVAGHARQAHAMRIARTAASYNSSSSSCNSPELYISITMSDPPISSPLT